MTNHRNTFPGPTKNIDPGKHLSWLHPFVQLRIDFNSYEPHYTEAFEL